jgi:hydroxymethylglutaryl-CoA reductase (NADPH)
MEDKIPRLKDDYTQEAIVARHDFIKEKTGVAVNHVGRYSFDPAILKGNIESFIGVAQVPIGIAGPLLLNGENAQGEFYVPMATTEGTLVASYNRGMKLVHQCGGVKTTIVDDAMQRAPVFVFDDACDARNFSHWVIQHFAEIKEVTDKTTSIGSLRNIEHYAAGKLLFLRFNFTTGGAAGQNMVGKATFAACEWLKTKHPTIRHYTLSGNMDTDKKSSFINSLHTRGKRVIAETTIPGDVITNIAKFPLGELLRLRNITNTGAMLAGSTSNGMHIRPTASRPSLSARVRMWPMWPSLRRPSYSLNRRPITAITFQSPSPP